MVILPNTFQKHNGTKRKLWLLFGGLLSVTSITASWWKKENIGYVPRIGQQKGAILLHDKARPHVSQLTLQKFNEWGYESLFPPPYSPILSPILLLVYQTFQQLLTREMLKKSSTTLSLSESQSGIPSVILIGKNLLTQVITFLTT